MRNERATLGPVVRLLEAIGFRKRAGTVFTLDLAPGVLGWLGLNRATQHRSPEVEVNPVVGVRFQDVERLVAECRGEKFHEYQPPTISTPLGYLMPAKQYERWLFAPGKSEQRVAQDLSEAIVNYGVRFMRSVIDLAELRRQLQRRLGFENQLAYRRPVAEFLAGDIERARALIDESVTALGSRTDDAAQDFRQFAHAFRARLPPQ